MMDRQAFEATFDRYWDWLQNEVATKPGVFFSPMNGNQRRVESISGNDIHLRETTARAAPSTATKAALQEDFWTLYSDPRVSTDGVEVLHARHGIKNLTEFKRAMFNEFADFGNLGVAIGRAHTVDSLPWEVYEPTADPVVLEERTLKLVRAGLESMPAGNLHPLRVTSEHTVFVRDPKVPAWILQENDGRCEACGEPGYETNNCSHFLEVHHMLPLSEGGPDVTDNAVAVCETCHGKLHRWNERDRLRKTLYSKLPRLREYPS